MKKFYLEIINSIIMIVILSIFTYYFRFQTVVITTLGIIVAKILTMDIMKYNKINTIDKNIQHDKITEGLEKSNMKNVETQKTNSRTSSTTTNK